MGFLVEPGEIVSEGLRRVALEQVALAQEELGQITSEAQESVRDEAVHEARKALKRLRALFLLLTQFLGKGVVRRENALIRGLGRGLSATRDAAVGLLVFDALSQVVTAEPGALQRLRQELAGVRDAAEEAAALSAIAVGIREQLSALAERIQGWPTPSEQAWPLIARDWQQTYRRGRRAGQLACVDSDAVVFHEWRKHVKHHYYQVSMLRNIWEPEMDLRRQLLDRLGELLGHDHDHAELAFKLEAFRLHAELGPAARLLQDAIAQRQGAFRQEALELGDRLYAEKPKAFGRRCSAYAELANRYLFPAFPPPGDAG